MARTSAQIEQLLFGAIRHMRASRQREADAERGQVPQCPCGRKLWSTSERRRGTCATCNARPPAPGP
jgi:hypothetical protein